MILEESVETDPRAFGESGEYRVKALVGEGSYAHTYLVERDGQELAVKWLRADSPPGSDKRFENEAWALRQLNHPSIPRLIAVGTLEGRPYIVMTFADGVSLRKLYERQVGDGGTLGQWRMLRIAEAILDALAHMHKRRIYHRDVKDANVLLDESSSHVTLVDLGVCKGDGQPVDADTFWEIGASKFSPPEKLNHPRHAHPTHDVFAVGVLGYLLLTNRYPWSVDPEGDRGDLVELMQRVIPPRIHVVNNMVRRDVSDFFTWLLQIDDDSRPTAPDALGRLRRMMEDLAESHTALTAVPRQGIAYHRVMRDPVHSDIVMTEFEWMLMRTPEFQRLRWIRQLGTSHLVYPGAEHTRFSHAIGTMQVASEIMRRIEQRRGERFDREEWLAARAFALVHDVSHIAYGHALEDEMGIFMRHDRNGARMSRLMSSTSTLGKLLRSEPYGEEVLKHFDSVSTPRKESWLTELLEAPCGADVLDYIERDAYYCGLDHKIDSAVYRWFSVQRPEWANSAAGHFQTELFGHHGFRLDADFALESILRERFALYLKVYTHPVKVAAGAMIGKAVWEALHGRKKTRFNEETVERMGDNELLYFLRTTAGPLSKRLAEMVLQRHLWKPAFQSRALRPDECDATHYDAQLAQFAENGLLDPKKRAKIEQSIGKAAGLSANEIILYCPPRAPGLQKLLQRVAPAPGKGILRGDVHDPHMRIRKAHMGLWTVFVFVPPDKKPNTLNRVAEASEEILRLRNEVDFERRQLVLEL